MSFFKKITIITICIFTAYLLISSINLYNTFNVRKKNKDFNSYYVKFEFNKEKDGMILDENNVTFVDYSKIKSLGVKNIISYNPVTIGGQGIRYYQKYCFNKNINNLSIFLSHADWLVENIRLDGSWNITHNKKIGRYILKAPWNSALSQGLGISVLVRAYKETNEEKYIITARKALIPFKKKIKNTGITTENNFGNFYEEYPLKENPTHVLNGFITSLFGLYDLYLYDNNIEAKKLFDIGIVTLKKSINLYDKGYWTKYSLNKNSTLKNHWNLASPWYQKLHVAQLYAIYKITNDSLFLKYSKKFQNQERNSWINYIIYPAYVLYIDFVKIYKYIKG